jgi:hypothetical protein
MQSWLKRVPKKTEIGLNTVIPKRTTIGMPGIFNRLVYKM